MLILSVTLVAILVGIVGLGVDMVRRNHKQAMAEKQRIDTSRFRATDEPGLPQGEAGRLEPVLDAEEASAFRRHYAADDLSALEQSFRRPKRSGIGYDDDGNLVEVPHATGPEVEFQPAPAEMALPAPVIGVAPEAPPYQPQPEAPAYQPPPAAPAYQALPEVPSYQALPEATAYQPLPEAPLQPAAAAAEHDDEEPFILYKQAPEPAPVQEPVAVYQPPAPAPEPGYAAYEPAPYDPYAAAPEPAPAYAPAPEPYYAPPVTEPVYAPPAPEPVYYSPPEPEPVFEPAPAPAPAPLPPVLVCQGYGAGFGDKVVLADVTLEVPGLGITTLMGPVGTGKSTLLRSLAGVLNQSGLFKSWGSATFRGAPAGPGNRPLLVAQRIQLTQRSALESLTYHLRDQMEHLPLDEQRDWAKQWLTQAGAPAIIPMLDKSFMELDQLSQRIVTILREAAAESALLMIDEPTTGLSEADASVLLAMLQRLAEFAPLLVVLHNQRHARRISDKIVLLAGGRVQAECDTATFFDYPPNPVVAQFVATGSCAVASPGALAEDLGESVAPPPPLSAAAMDAIKSEIRAALAPEPAPAPQPVMQQPAPAYWAPPQAAPEPVPAPPYQAPPPQFQPMPAEPQASWTPQPAPEPAYQPVPPPQTSWAAAPAPAPEPASFTQAPPPPVYWTPPPAEPPAPPAIAAAPQAAPAYEPPPPPPPAPVLEAPPAPPPPAYQAPAAPPPPVSNVITAAPPPAPAAPASQLRSERAAVTRYPGGSAGPRGFVWIEEGRLAATPMPGISTNVDYDLDLLKGVGVTVLISLTEKNFPQAPLGRHGLRNLHLPIADRKAPTAAETDVLVSQMRELLNNGEVLAVHCLAGLGRTGTILAAYLVKEKGLSAQTALNQIRRFNRQFVQSDDQEDFLVEYEVQQEQTVLMNRATDTAKF